MSGVLPESTTSPFVDAWLPRVAEALRATGGANGCLRALDLAMGEGRHAFPLVEAGFLTIGVDLSIERLHTARRSAGTRRLVLHQFAADLDTYPLPPERFDLLFCTRFLLRARWQDLKRCVKPGGFVMYETFTVGQLAIKHGPRSHDHLLQYGELARAFAGWETWLSEEVHAPAAVARIVARKPARHA